MTTEEELGGRELAKKEAKKEKHKAFGIVADKFVQLAQEALNECKDVVLSFHYMDCRGVTGIRKVGSRIKKFI